MKRLISIVLIITLVFTSLFAQAVQEEVKKETVSFTDSSGRVVEIPATIDRVAPSGAVATMFLSAFAPEKMCTVSGRPSNAQMAYLPEELASLPETGQMYGSKATLNLEELLASGAELVIDLGDYKDGIQEDLDALQSQIGIPVIFIEANMESMASAFRTLGKVLSMEERGEALGAFVDETMAMAAENKGKIKDKVSVMYTTTADGLGTNAKGSTQAQVLEIVGAENAIVVENVSDKGGGNQINLETAMMADPDVIIFTEESIYKEVSTLSGWKEMTAVKNGSYYMVPTMPYNWLGNPPSMNMLIGVWWLGNLLYPEYYSYSMVDKAREIYSLLWGYDLSVEEAETMLERAKN
ncbi:MAG: ABC transporter substrate-binding protein [Candidatus Ornithospirochaeta sp.]